MIRFKRKIEEKKNVSDHVWNVLETQEMMRNNCGVLTVLEWLKLGLIQGYLPMTMDC